MDRIDHPAILRCVFYNNRMINSSQTQPGDAGFVILDSAMLAFNQRDFDLSFRRHDLPQNLFNALAAFGSNGFG